MAATTRRCAGLKSVLDSDLPNLVHSTSRPSPVLAERLLEFVPYLDKVFFANSGAECVEAAIKFARGATGRPASCTAPRLPRLSYGALSLTDDPNFRAGFEPLLPDARDPVQRPRALEQALSSRQSPPSSSSDPGQGLNMPTDEFLPGAARCAANTARCSSPTKSRPASAAPAASSRRALERRARHVLLAKALSGGHVRSARCSAQIDLRQDFTR